MLNNEMYSFFLKFLLRLEEEYWFSLGFFLQEVDLFTRHFDLKAKVRKAFLVNRFFLFRRHDFCYDHMTSQPLCSFFNAISTELHV